MDLWPPNNFQRKGSQGKGVVDLGSFFVVASLQHPALLHIAATIWDSNSGHSTVAAASFPSSKPLGLLKDN